jgi:hypothetical protein
MPAVTILRHDCDTHVDSVEFGLLAQASCCSVLWVFTDGETYPSAVLAPFEVVGTFGMAFGLAIYDDQVGLDPSIRRQDHWAISRALAGLDAFGEVYFFGLSVGHW